jgi:hypothetical protein
MIWLALIGALGISSALVTCVATLTDPETAMAVDRALGGNVHLLPSLVFGVTVVSLACLVVAVMYGFPGGH